jgi:hypothetical protein
MAQVCKCASRHRSKLSSALQMDDANALLRQLDACGGLSRTALLADDCTSAFSGDPCGKGVVRSAALNVDHQLCVSLRFHQQANIPSVVLNCAIALGMERAVELLLSERYHGVIDPASENNFAIIAASAQGNTNVVKLLLRDLRVDPAADMNEAIRCASERGHIRVVKELLSDLRVDPSEANGSGLLALYCACLNGHDDVAQLLLSDARVDPSANDNEAVRSASLDDDADIVKLLLQDPRFKVGADEEVMRIALNWATTCTLRALISDGRMAITAGLLCIVDEELSENQVDSFFDAAGPHIWPEVISDHLECAPRDRGCLRRKLDEIETEAAWVLLLCVKRRFSARLCARVGDVLRETCDEWTTYRTHQVHSLEVAPDAYERFPSKYVRSNIE